MRKMNFHLLPTIWNHIQILYTKIFIIFCILKYFRDNCLHMCSMYLSVFVSETIVYNNENNKVAHMIEIIIYFVFIVFFLLQWE